MANQSAQRDHDVVRKNSAVGNNRNSQLTRCAIKRVVFSIAFGGLADAYYRADGYNNIAVVVIADSNNRRSGLSGRTVVGVGGLEPTAE